MTKPLGKFALPQRALDVYRCLKGAADRGDECPTNNFLAAVGDYSQANHAGSAVALLEQLGLIQVTRYNRARVVTVAETGKSTKPVDGKPVRYLANRKRATA